MLNSIRFGDNFELDRRSRKLYRAGRLLRLERIPMEVLQLLMERNGEVVTREEIVAKIWGDGVFLDTDNSINGAIRKVRQVLRDNPENPEFIQTVTGVGYRFISQLPSESPDPPMSPVSEPFPQTVPDLVTDTPQADSPPFGTAHGKSF